MAYREPRSNLAYGTGRCVIPCMNKIPMCKKENSVKHFKRLTACMRTEALSGLSGGIVWGGGVGGGLGLCFLVPFRLRLLFPCSPEINGLIPLFPKTSGRAS